MRVCVVGFGTVGRWLGAVLATERPQLRERYGVSVQLVGVANARHGLIYCGDGLDPGGIIDLVGSGRPLSDYPGSTQWSSATQGLREIEYDLLVETSASPPGDGEPGLTHMREALGRGIDVVTSNKWPVALAGVELAALADESRLEFRAESTVMSGTPVLRALTDGLAGARPRALRGVLNATVNSILTTMRHGSTYADALAEAQAEGLAEPDPSADVEGHDSVAKLMILSALVLGRQLRVDAVARRSVAELDDAELAAGGDPELHLREVATLELLEPDGEVRAAVAPRLLAADDPLARIEGTMNALVCRAEPLGEVRVVGPGAGPRLAGQGVLSDLISVGRTRRH